MKNLAESIYQRLLTAEQTIAQGHTIMLASTGRTLDMKEECIRHISYALEDNSFHFSYGSPEVYERYTEEEAEFSNTKFIDQQGLELYLNRSEKELKKLFPEATIWVDYNTEGDMDDIFVTLKF